MMDPPSAPALDQKSSGTTALRRESSIEPRKVCPKANVNHWV